LASKGKVLLRKFVSFSLLTEAMFCGSELNEHKSQLEPEVIIIKEEITVKKESSSILTPSSRPKSRHRSRHRTARVKNNNGDNRNFGNWSPEEDAILLRFINENGGGKWAKLSKGEFEGSRNAQQCKRRWDALTRLILQRKKID